MPELPEVETIRRTLLPMIRGRIVTDVNVFYPPITPDGPDFVRTTLAGRTITDVRRVGKHLVLVMGDRVLLVHFRMEGRFFIRKTIRESKHDHVAITLDGMDHLVYNDTRKFGRMLVRNNPGYMDVPPLSLLGPEPADADPKRIWDMLRSRKVAIKTALLDQHVMAGLGNIYVDETLFSSRIHPMRSSQTLSRKDVFRIVTEAARVLGEACTLGGSSIRTYTDALGVHGRFQNVLNVHTKVGEPCPTCGQTIIKTVVGGRGTYVCERCQKK
jgi:formamidopyrimidine-DNA glycosylase